MNRVAVCVGLVQDSRLFLAEVDREYMGKTFGHMFVHKLTSFGHVCFALRRCAAAEPVELTDAAEAAAASKVSLGELTRVSPHTRPAPRLSRVCTLWRGGGRGSFALLHRLCVLL